MTAAFNLSQLANNLNSSGQLDATDGLTGVLPLVNGGTGSTTGSPPPGTVLYHAANTPPNGFLKANGAAISRTTYANLFAVIGTTFGAGDGSTTFNVPDLRGYFLRAWDDSRGVDSGRVFGSSQTDAFQGHQHTTKIGGNYPNGSIVGQLDASVDFGSRTTLSIVSDGTSGSPRTASETRPINIALLACIKY